MNLIESAIRFAANAHTGQLDRQGNPYILHPLRMLMRMRQKGLPESHQAVTMLHDVVEDTGVRMMDIHHNFNNLVAMSVDAITRRVDENGVAVESYKEYVMRCCEDPIARVVKKFDVEDNMDPRRWHPGVPYKRYLWALQYMSGLGPE